MESTNTLFPIFLKLDQLNTLVVGGGNVALEKVSALLRNSPQANITMIFTKLLFIKEDFWRRI
jgi:siroheme synthase (precorrin-2 oxidase/ferrochelatase)